MFMGLLAGLFSALPLYAFIPSISSAFHSCPSVAQYSDGNIPQLTNFRTNELTNFSPCPFRHRTRYYDSETWLYYYGHRYYDPATTQWISKDPLGESGGWNLHAFCEGDPINNWDALGDTNEPGDFGWEWYSVFIPELAPVFENFLPREPECWITAAPPRKRRPR
jgi:RHS repeat-associated protein